MSSMQLPYRKPQFKETPSNPRARRVPAPRNWGNKEEGINLLIPALIVILYPVTLLGKGGRFGQE